MTDRLLVDLGGEGRVSVSTWLEGELPDGPSTEPFELVWPLDGEALEDLRWYLEDYLRAPYGVYGDRGPEVARSLGDWGQAVFKAVFGTGVARDAYIRLRTRGRSAEIVFRSSSAALLGLPWELLRDPARPTPLALDMVGVTRSLPTSELGEAFAEAGESLRVLMVISRPGGSADVGYRMVARPLVGRLEAVRGSVELVVLRPPTLEALGEMLAAGLAEGRPFQVVHFDGHGMLAGRHRPLAVWGNSVSFQGPEAEGMLVFEKPGGGRDDVPAARLAQVLKAGRVPLVVLNACQSGAVGKELEAAVATRLLQEGVASVVAMAYSVYAVAAAEFMAAFYDRLFAGAGVTEAVSAGRVRLYQHDQRPSPKGQMGLADWMVPVHYLRRELHFPHLRSERSSGLSLDEALDRLRDHTRQEDEGLEPVGTFVGRDGLFYELEVAARLQRVVVLHGPGGTGKTELAKAFGRWWRDTGGVEHPEWVMLESFEPGLASFGLEGVVTAIGLRVFGPDFARLGREERQATVEDLLQTRRLLLIWDNFETVVSMPDPTGATPPLEEKGRQELRQFLRRLAAGGRSALIITSRTEEAWLGEVRRIEMGSLTADEAIEYADDLLAPYPSAAPRRGRRAFAELLEWLDGHPLAMRLVLPHLATTEPELLLEGLRGLGELPAGEDGGRTSSLAASITYSFDHVGPRSHRLLLAVCLFHGVADADVLAMFSQVPQVPERFRGISRQEWTEVLDEAARVGLLPRLGAGMYRIHPALPAYLAARWRSEEPNHYDQHRDAATGALLTAHASLARWLRQQITGGDAGLAFAIIDHQRRTLGHLLGYALDVGLWDEASAIAAALHDYLNARGLHQEANAWVDRARLALEAADGRPPAMETSAGALWLFFVGSQANRELGSHQLDSAEGTYLAILGMLETQPASHEQQQRLAVTYHQLGMVAEERARLEDAEEWYLKSLAIEEELGNRPGMAASYHQLGMVAQKRDRLDDADGWYLKSLAINEELGNRPGIARSYHQLGIVAHLRGRLDDAEDWYLESLAVKEELGDRPGTATSHHQLGMVAELRGRLDEAEAWYLKSLAVREELSDRLGMASSYHQLGSVAQDRGRLDDAEGWYLNSLGIREELGDRPGMAISYGQLGLLAEARGHGRAAMEWTVRCVALFDEFPHPATGPGPAHLARLTLKLGIDMLEECWRTVTGAALPQAVHDFVRGRGKPDAHGEGSR